MSSEGKHAGNDQMKTTAYFREQVLRKRAYLKPEWCIAILADYVAREVQPDGRIRFWGYIEELNGKALRVVTLEDGETVHNAFPDSGFARRKDEASLLRRY